MEISYGNIIWKYHMEISYGNIIWKYHMEILLTEYPGEGIISRAQFPE